MIHYHGGPITPETCQLRAWSGGHAFISYGSTEARVREAQVEMAAGVCQSFALDNGAFSLWKADKPTDWPGYYDWCVRWLDHPACDWAVIPDVIGGTEAENDALVAEWPYGFAGVPVWHLNESAQRLYRLAADWPRIALGSAAEYDVSRPSRCIERLAEVLPPLATEAGLTVKLHGLRMLNPAVFTRVPLASADSTNIAHNIGIDVAWRGPYMPATKEARTVVLRERIESHQSPAFMSEPPPPERLFEVCFT